MAPERGSLDNRWRREQGNVNGQPYQQYHISVSSSALNLGRGASTFHFSSFNETKCKHGPERLFWLIIVQNCIWYNTKSWLQSRRESWHKVKGKLKHSHKSLQLHLNWLFVIGLSPLFGKTALPAWLHKSLSLNVKWLQVLMMHKNSEPF